MTRKKADPERWFKVTGDVTVSAYRYVRAQSADEAMRKTAGDEPALAPYGPDRSGVSPLEQPIVEDADGTFVPTEAAEEDPAPEWLEDAGEEVDENG